VHQVSVYIKLQNNTNKEAINPASIGTTLT